jgi:hypothetical protein
VAFSLPVKALSAIYRATFRELMRRLDLFAAIPEEVWAIDWNVNGQPWGKARRPSPPSRPPCSASPSRTAASSRSRTTPSGSAPASHRLRTLALDVLEFLRRFLQPVLPTGCMKVRSSGVLNPHCALPRDRLVALLELAAGFPLASVPAVAPAPPSPLQCRQCGGRLVYRWTLRPAPRSP